MTDTVNGALVQTECEIVSVLYDRDGSPRWFDGKVGP